MCDQQIGMVCIRPNIVQQIVDALCEPQHGLARPEAVNKVFLGTLKALAVPGCSFPDPEVLLPEAWLDRKRQFEYVCDFLRGIPRAA